ncbi:hypothetical protein [Histidinibacterium lentulum]|uniref:Uncharacterized protein n=1 Tax=Histidinibacterium lentulum TaxID=2480588 RepID=A0A3N2R0T0_9RHOB|nr:hypothetical protein [Histidinibacterium lentulum]ROU01087.1 hypothetical protein EAT49_11210 [Histidinibacterium lentulum]
MGHRPAALVLALCSAGGSAAADHVLQSADPTLVEALAVIARAYDSACDAGSTAHCHMVYRIGIEGHILLSAGYACRWETDMEACVLYDSGTGRIVEDLTGLHPDALPVTDTPGWVPPEVVDTGSPRPWGREEVDALLVRLLSPPLSQMTLAEQHERFIERLRE